jgi:glycosyltransferase involved in cell wall biosynthesis
MTYHFSVGQQRDSNTSLLTIITVNKDNCAGVERTIASLLPLKANKSPVDFIFVDGCSKDCSVQVAKSFYFSNCIISESDSGIYSAMNKGLSLAVGDWVIWINSGDEFIYSSWPLLQDLLRRADVSVLCGAAEIIDDRYLKTPIIRKSSYGDLPWDMVNHSSTFLRRDMALAYGGYDESYCIAADRKLLLRIFLSGEKFVFTDICCSRFWLGGISSKKLFLRVRENLRIDLETGLIKPINYVYGMCRHFIFFIFLRPSVHTLRQVFAFFGLSLPPLGRNAGVLGELRRNAFADRPSA